MSVDSRLKRLIGGSIGRQVIIECSRGNVTGVIRRARFLEWRKERSNNAALFKVIVEVSSETTATPSLETFIVKKLPTRCAGGLCEKTAILKDFTPKFGEPR